MINQGCIFYTPLYRGEGKILAWVGKMGFVVSSFCVSRICYINQNHDSVQAERELSKEALKPLEELKAKHDELLKESFVIIINIDTYKILQPCFKQLLQTKD